MQRLMHLQLGIRNATTTSFQPSRHPNNAEACSRSPRHFRLPLRPWPALQVTELLGYVPQNKVRTHVAHNKKPLDLDLSRTPAASPPDVAVADGNPASTASDPSEDESELDLSVDWLERRKEQGFTDQLPSIIDMLVAGGVNMTKRTLSRGANASRLAIASLTSGAGSAAGSAAGGPDQVMAARAQQQAASGSRARSRRAHARAQLQPAQKMALNLRDLDAVEAGESDEGVFRQLTPEQLEQLVAASTDLAKRR
jgi:hypothetical protein